MGKSCHTALVSVRVPNEFLARLVMWQYEKKYEASMKTVNALKVGIQSIFNKIGCNTPANMEMLGNEVQQLH